MLCPLRKRDFADFWQTTKTRLHLSNLAKFTDAEGKVTEAFVGSGLLEFFDNRANLVCISAELPEEIDKRRAQEAAERAEEELRQQHSLDEYYQIQANLSRAMERLKIKNKHQI